MMHRIVAGAATLLAMTVMASCSRLASPVAPSATPEQLRRAYAMLATAQDADSLAAAALTARVLTDAAAHPGRPLALVGRAVASAPRRADLAVLQLQLCEASPGCDAREAEAQQRQLDPQNGISWVYALRRANRLHDAPGERMALAGLAGAQGVELHWTGLGSRMAAAMAARGGLDAPTALSALIDAEAALHLPLTSLSDSCSAPALSDASLLARCRGAAEVLQHADTILVAMYGNRLAVRLWAESSARRAQLAVAGRPLEYQMDLMRSNSDALDSPRALQLLAMLYPHYATEQGVIRALYVKLGLRPDPPVHWRQKVFAGRL